MSSRSIRLSMTGGFSLAIATLIAAACFGLIWYSRHTAAENADRALDTVAKQLRSELAGAKNADEFKRLIAEEREELDVDDIVLAIVSGGDRTLMNSNQTDIRQLLLAGDGWRARTIRVGRVTIKIGVSWNRTESDLKYHASALLVLGAIVVALATGGAWVLVGRTLSPIAALAQQANAASTQKLQVRLQEPSPDAEIVELVATLNGLLSGLSETVEVKKRFYSAASHELRTPLQALSGHLELALRKDRTEQEYKRAIEEAYGQAHRLIVLVQDLLLLYQLESDAPSAPVVRSDLTLALERAMGLCRPIMELHGLSMRTDLPVSAEVLAPPAHADVLVRNLLENAAKYADHGSELLVNLLVDKRRLELVIYNAYSSTPDSGVAAVPDSECPLSYRDGGAGLGLSICQAIAASNKWDLSVRQEDAGVRATLTIPSRGMEV